MKRPDAAIAGAVILFLVYVLTLAPDVTFWDAGEFIAAAHSLGIPHPPGTPLFILVINVWAKLLFFLPYAVATNLFSAVATAAAALITARMVRRATCSDAMALATALVAGSMSSVWLNATETEVYAASLLLAVLMIWSAERAGREADERWTALTAYLMALAVPLHLSALVVAPVALLLAAWAPDGVHWRRAVLLGGTFVAAMGGGRVSPWMIGAGAALILLSMVVPGDPARAWSRLGTSLGVVGVAALACSALAFLYVRAHFDPAINQGNPATLHDLANAVARRQYAVSPMWPREAPAWIQLANVGQYADWQVALSTGPTVMPSILRTLGTVLFLFLAYEGAVAHWQRDRRTWAAMLMLLVVGSLGVAVYLNMHPGPSILYGILPPDTIREARERDYFYVFAFWAWGVWAGIGAVSVAQRTYARPAWAGVLVAALPIALNWRAVTRRGEPEQSLPHRVAEAMLEAVPRNGVLFVAGDNDSYPLWYAQQVLGLRRDVAVITIPLMPTRWYRAEVARRHHLLTAEDVNHYEPRLGTAAAAAAGARKLGRPVAASITVSAAERQRLASSWSAGGLAYVEGAPAIDTVAARRWSAWVAARVPWKEARPAIDPVNSYFRRVLDCPRQFVEQSKMADSTRLDSACNYR